MYDKRQFQDLKPGEIAGMGTINPVMRFLRNIRSTQSHVHIDGNPGGGIDIAVDVPESGSSGASFRHGFQPTISGNVLTIGAGLAVVGTRTFDSGSTQEFLAPSAVQASTWTIDSSKQKYFGHYHSVTTYVEQQSGGYTGTEVTTFDVERASDWPAIYRYVSVDTSSGWTATVDENWPLLEIVGASGAYQAIVHSFGIQIIVT